MTKSKIFTNFQKKETGESKSQYIFGRNVKLNYSTKNSFLKTFCRQFLLIEV